MGEPSKMTVERARVIIGKEYDIVPDEIIEGLINLFSNYATLVISQHIAKKRAAILANAKQPEKKLNKEWHKVNIMPLKATLDQKIKWHIEHVAHCKCRKMPDKIKQEI